MSRNNSTQSSNFQSQDAISSPTLPLGTTVLPSGDPASENSTPRSGPEIHHLSQTPVYCPQPDWRESVDFNAFTDAISANLTQQPTSMTVPSHPTYCPQPEWSESNDFQSFVDPTSTVSMELPQSGLIGYSPPWSKSNNINPIMETPADLTQPSLSEPSNFRQDPIARQQPGLSRYNGLQHLSANSLNTPIQIYQSGQPVRSAC